MTWVKLDDGFISHPKTFNLSHKAIVLHIAGLCHSASSLLDGLIDKNRMPVVLGMARCTKRQLTELVEAGMWIDQGKHYEIHDYLKYQESRETVLKRREQATERKRKSREESQRDEPCDETRGHTAPDPTRPVITSSASSSSSSSKNQPPARVDTYMGQAVDKVTGKPIVIDISSTFRTVKDAAS